MLGTGALLNPSFRRTTLSPLGLQLVRTCKARGAAVRRPPVFRVRASKEGPGTPPPEGEPDPKRTARERELQSLLAILVR